MPPAPCRARRPALIAALLLFGATYGVAPSARPYAAATIVAWLASIIAFLFIVRPPAAGGGPLHRASAAWRAGGAGRGRVLLLAAILLLAALLRLAKLEAVPPLFYGDEGEMGVDALAIVQDRPDAPWFFGTGFLEHPSLHFYLEALSIHLFGVTILALRLVTALWGIVGVLATYGAGRVLLTRRAALFAAAIAASAPVDLQLSRVSLNNVETAVFATLAIGSLALGIGGLAAPEGPEGFWGTALPFRFGLAGVFGGLSLYFYFGSRVIPLILCLICLYALLRFPRRRGALLRGWAVLLAGLLVAFLPQLAYYVQHPQSAGTSRAGQYFVFNHMRELEAQLHLAGPWAVLASQVRETWGQFFTRPDSSTFFPFQAPILLGPVAALFLGGLILAFRSPLRPAHAVLLIWFWATFVAGGVLTGDAPYTPRIVGLLPAVYLLAALALDWFLREAAALAPGTSRWLTPLAALLLLAVTATSIDDYFTVYFRSDPNPTVTAVARFLAGLPADTYVYDLADGLFFAYGPNRYLASRIAGQDLLDPPRQVPTLVHKGRRLAFIVFPRWSGLLPEIEARFPGGRVREETGYQGALLFTTYVVDRGT